MAGIGLAVLDKCIAVHKEGPTQRNLAGFLPYQLALEQGPSHRAQAERLALAAGKVLPSCPVNSVLVRSASSRSSGAGSATDRDEV